MAMPRSAAASAGASFRPSPTNATCPPLVRARSRMTSSFSAGSRPARTSAHPDLGGDGPGSRFIVAGQHNARKSRRRQFRQSRTGLSGRILSASRITPTSRSPAATQASVPGWSFARVLIRHASVLMPASAKKRSEPTRMTLAVHRVPSSPRPGTARILLACGNHVHARLLCGMAEDGAGRGGARCRSLLRRQAGAILPRPAPSAG
jgi:hypothetical protein